MAGTSHEQYSADAREQISTVEDLQQVYRDLAEQQLDELAEIQDAQADLNEEMAKGTTSAQGLLGQLKAMGTQLAALAGMAAAAGAAVKFVGDETARLDAYAKGAQKTGLGFSAYQQLAHIAELSGTNVEALSKSTVKLQLSLRDLDGTGKVANKALEELGINTEALAREDDIGRLEYLSEAFSKLPDGANKSALAVEIFGKSGKELIPLLNSGAEGIDAMIDSSGRLFTREELARAEAYQDSLTNLNKAVADAKGEIAVGLAPVLQDFTSKLRDGVNEGARVIPSLVKVVQQVGKALGPVVNYVEFWANELARAGRVIELVDRYASKAADSAEEFGDRTLAWARDTSVGQWLSETAGELEGIGGDGGWLAETTDKLRSQVPILDEAALAWGEVSRAISGASAASSEMSAIGQASAKLTQFMGDAAAYGQEIEESEEARLAALTRSAVYAEHNVRLAEAQKRPAAELEDLYQRQHMARVDLYQATGEQLKLEQALRDEAVRQAAASAKRSVAGSTEAQRLKAANDAQLDYWRDSLAFLELEAEARGTLAESAQRFAEERYAIEYQALELERQVLEATRARGAVERINNEARIQAIQREQAILDITETLRQREEEARLIREATEATKARTQVEAELARQENARLAEVIDLEEYRLRSAEASARSRGDLAMVQARTEGERLRAQQTMEDELHRIRLQQIRTEAQARQQELAARRAVVEAMPIDTEIERLRRQDEVRKLSHDEEMERLRVELDTRQVIEAEKVAMAERERAHHAAQMQMVADSVATFESIQSSVTELAGFLSEVRNRREDAELQSTIEGLEAQGQAQRDSYQRQIEAAKGNVALQSKLRKQQEQSDARLRKQVEQAEKKHQEKRERQEMRSQGISLMIVAAVETVKAIAAYAQLNIPQGLAHTAAAIAAGVKGGMLLSGQVPSAAGGTSSAGSSGGMAANDQEYADPSNVPGSRPGEAARRASGSSTGSPAQREAGGVVIQIGEINSMGSIDQDFTENMARELDRLSYSREY